MSKARFYRRATETQEAFAERLITKLLKADVESRWFKLGEASYAVGIMVKGKNPADAGAIKTLVDALTAYVATIKVEQ